MLAPIYTIQLQIGELPSIWLNNYQWRCTELLIVPMIKGRVILRADELVHIPDFS